MPTLTISLDAGAQSRSMARTVSVAHLTRFIAALKLRFGSGLTDAQAFDAWAQQLVFDAARNLTLKEEERAAQKSATASIDEIDLT